MYPACAGGWAPVVPGGCGAGLAVGGFPGSGFCPCLVGRMMPSTRCCAGGWSSAEEFRATTTVAQTAAVRIAASAPLERRRICARVFITRLRCGITCSPVESTCRPWTCARHRDNGSTRVCRCARYDSDTSPTSPSSQGTRCAPRHPAFQQSHAPARAHRSLAANGSALAAVPQCGPARSADRGTPR